MTAVTPYPGREVAAALAAARDDREDMAGDPDCRKVGPAEQVLRTSIDYLLGDLDRVASSLRAILEGLDEGDGALVVYSSYAVVHTLDDEFGQLSLRRRLEHVQDCAGAFALRDPGWIRDCCEQGLIEQRSLMSQDFTS